MAAMRISCPREIDWGRLFRISHHCTQSTAGGLCIEEGISILLCANRLQDEDEVRSTILHELLHAVDWCRGGSPAYASNQTASGRMDFSDLRAHACSEVRAASLSGDCSMIQEWQRRNISILDPASFFSFKELCVKRRSAISLSMNPKCQDRGTAKAVVEEVYDQCVKDRHPF